MLAFEHRRLIQHEKVIDPLDIESLRPVHGLRVPLVEERRCAGLSNLACPQGAAESKIRRGSYTVPVSHSSGEDHPVVIREADIGEVGDARNLRWIRAWHRAA